MAGTQACVSALPQAIDALVALAQTYVPSGVSVYDGEAASDDPGDFLMVGVQDPDSDTMSLSGESQQGWSSVGYGSGYTDESGDITCAAVAWNGDSGNAAQKAARDDAYEIAKALAKAISIDPTLGLGDWFRGCRFGTQITLSQMTGDSGVSALLVFQIHFDAYIYRPS